MDIEENVVIYPIGEDKKTEKVKRAPRGKGKKKTVTSDTSVAESQTSDKPAAETSDKPAAKKPRKPRVAASDNPDAPAKKPKASTEPKSCPICADHYTPILRREIQCKWCKVSSCRPCIERYLLTRFEDAHCMHCRVNYNDAVLKTICTHSYLTAEYFKHRQEILVNRERANLPALQETAITERRIRELSNDVKEYERQSRVWRQEKNNASSRYVIAQVQELEKSAKLYQMGITRPHLPMNRDTLTPEQNTAINELNELTERKKNASKEQYDARIAYRTIREEIQQLQRRIMRLRHPEHANEEEKKDDPETAEKRKFIRRCMRDGCQGFLSTAWKCGLCEWYSCSKCFTVRGAEHDTPHECKKEDVETAEMIRKDSKPCPKCGEFIMKSSGCDQMFCISCKTPWSWNSGQIITKGVLHNPHYYEWMQRTGGQMPRNPADVPCGGYPRGSALLDLSYSTVHIADSFSYPEFHRLCMELQDVSENNYRSHIDENPMNAIHIRFLIGDFDETVWGRHLAMNEKQRKRDAEVQDVFAAFRMVAVELINRIQNYTGIHPVHGSQVRFIQLLPKKEVSAILSAWTEEVLRLFEMINDAMRNISVAYDYTVPFIHIGISYRRGIEGPYYRLLHKNFVTDERHKRRVQKEQAQKEQKEQKEQEQQTQPQTLSQSSEAYDEKEEEDEKESSHQAVHNMITNAIPFNEQTDEVLDESDESDESDDMAYQQAILASLTSKN